MYNQELELDEVKRIYRAYADLLDFTPGMYEGVSTVRIDAKYYRHETLAKIHNAVESGEIHIAVQELRDISDKTIYMYQHLPADELVANFESLRSAVALAKDAKAAYDSWVTGYYTPFLQSFMTHDFFDETELNPDDVHPNFFIDLKATSKYMNSFKYSTGSGTLDGMPHAPMRVGKDIIIIDDVSKFFAYLKRQDMQDGVVYAHILMKVEERMDLSHFILSVTYNGHSFISADMPTFATPQNKNATRNPRRQMVTKYDNLSFP